MLFRSEKTSAQVKFKAADETVGVWGDIQELPTLTVIAERIAYERYFVSSHPAKKWVRDRMVELLNSESVVPSFSAVATKLTTMVRNENLTIDDLGQVISLDPGLAARCDAPDTY